MSKMAATVAILKFLWHLLQNRKLDLAEAWLEASELHWNLELLKSFGTNIQDGRHGSYLENLQTTCAQCKLDWAKTW